MTELIKGPYVIAADRGSLSLTSGSSAQPDKCRHLRKRRWRCAGNASMVGVRHPPSQQPGVLSRDLTHAPPEGESNRRPGVQPQAPSRTPKGSQSIERPVDLPQQAGNPYRFGDSCMPENMRTAVPGDPVAHAIAQIRAQVPTAARVRAHRSPNGTYCVTVVDAGGFPVVLSALDSQAVGTWAVRPLPQARRSSPHSLDLETGRLTCAFTGEDVTAAARR